MSTILAIITKDGQVYAAAEIEAESIYSTHVLRPLGSWPKANAQRIHVGDVERIVAIDTTSQSVKEWAEGRGLVITS